MSVSYSCGPFTFEPTGPVTRINNVDHRSYELFYGYKSLITRRVPQPANFDRIREVFSQDMADWRNKAMAEHAPERVDLVDQATGEATASFRSHDVCGMTPGLIDDRAAYWIRSSDRLYSRPVTLSEFGAIVAAHAAGARSWIAGLLPEEVLTTDVDGWRAPSAWEIRHVVGEGSLTGLSGAAAAAMVGISPANFRKYTAGESAKNRQSMSYAAWHLLLQKMGIQRA